jgi:hypothetical protein
MGGSSHSESFDLTSNIRRRKTKQMIQGCTGDGKPNEILYIFSLSVIKRSHFQFLLKY